MVDQHLRARGIADPAVLAAMADLPREAFVPVGSRSQAYADAALPIDAGQTISQPYVVALMTEALELAPGDHVLEIGTGSGYQAAVLSRCGAQVDTVERVAVLAEASVAVLGSLGVEGVEVHVGDGTMGWPDGAPYDAIIVTAGGPDVPAALVGQLAPGGRLVMPAGPEGRQRLVRVRRGTDGELAPVEDLGGVAFVPLIGEQGWSR
jgi:protein-L-isoaspartate(D-aspartate) O-methyltransferase